MLFILYLLIGALAGTLSGLIGLGGGLVVVPLLVTLFKQENLFPEEMVMHFAAGTSLAIMIVTTSSSLRAHISHGNRIWDIFKTLMPGIIIGAVIGSIVADILQSDTLELMFGGLLVIVAYRAFFARTTHAAEKLPPLWVNYLISTAIGSLSGLFGIGGGMLLAPFLLYCNVSIRRAVALSAACGFLVSIIGSASYMITGSNENQGIDWVTGFIYWPAFLGIAITSPIFAYYGAKLSSKLSRTLLQKIFAFFMLITAIKFLFFR